MKQTRTAHRLDKAPILFCLLALAFLLPLFFSVDACAAQETKAESRSISVLSTTGNGVKVNKGGKQQFSATVNMALRDGYTITTDAESTVYFQADDDKVIKLGSSSSVAISKASAKKLCITLKSGDLYFNVKNPLAADSELSFRAGNTSMGIRGTSGWIGSRSETVTAMLFSGEADITAGDLSVSLTPGIQVVAQEKRLETQAADLKQIPAFALEAALENTATVPLTTFGVTDQVKQALIASLPEKKAQESTQLVKESKKAEQSEADDFKREQPKKEEPAPPAASSDNRPPVDDSSPVDEPPDSYTLTIENGSIINGKTSGAVTYRLTGAKPFVFTVTTQGQPSGRPFSQTFNSNALYRNGSPPADLPNNITVSFSPVSEQELTMTIQPPSPSLSTDVEVTVKLKGEESNFYFAADALILEDKTLYTANQNGVFLDNGLVTLSFSANRTWNGFVLVAPVTDDPWSSLPTPTATEIQTVVSSSPPPSGCQVFSYPNLNPDIEIPFQFCPGGALGQEYVYYLAGVDASGNTQVLKQTFMVPNA